MIATPAIPDVVRVPHSPSPWTISSALPSWRRSNPRPSAWEPDALPLSYPSGDEPNPKPDVTIDSPRIRRGAGPLVSVATSIDTNHTECAIGSAVILLSEARSCDLASLHLSFATSLHFARRRARSFSSSPASVASTSTPSGKGGRGGSPMPSRTRGCW